jgi:hypothetical protein
VKLGTEKLYWVVGCICNKLLERCLFVQLGMKTLLGSRLYM